MIITRGEWQLKNMGLTKYANSLKVPVVWYINPAILKEVLS